MTGGKRFGYKMELICFLLYVLIRDWGCGYHVVGKYGTLESGDWMYTFYLFSSHFVFSSAGCRKVLWGVFSTIKMKWRKHSNQITACTCGVKLISEQLSVRDLFSQLCGGSGERYDWMPNRVLYAIVATDKSYRRHGRSPGISEPILRIITFLAHASLLIRAL